MPRQERTKSGTGIYHVMLRGINKQDIFEDDEDYSQFLNILHALVNRYDEKGRMVKKILPQCEYTQYWYDTAGRMKFMQDANLRSNGLYRFMLYDKFGRLCVQGTCSSCWRGETVNTATYSSAGSDIQNTGYVVTRPGDIGGTVTLEIVNYYDNYNFCNRYTSYPLNQASTSTTTGLLTGTIQKTSDGDNLLDAFYYDFKGRITANRSIRLSHLTTTTTSYNYWGAVSETNQIIYPGINTSATPLLTINTTNSYNTNGLLTSISQSVKAGSGTVNTRTISSLDYDGLGRIKSNSRSGNAGTISYNYNPRGWITKINGKGFSEWLHYADSINPHYNGNISIQMWKAYGDTYNRGYQFSYDGLNRLTEAIYGENNFGKHDNRYNEKVVEYSANSMMKRFQRRGLKDDGQYGKVDNLHIYLDGNRPDKITDDADLQTVYGAMEFRDLADLPQEYYYDGNGSLVADANKGIAHIDYDNLNYPKRIQFTNGNTIEYVYAPDGQKLRATYQTAAGNVVVPLNTTQTITASTTSQTDYIGNVILSGTSSGSSTNVTLDKFLFAGGYTSFPTPTTSDVHYYTQDHLGNNRSVVNESGTVEQVTHYYPFGGVFADAGTGSSLQPYKYNGKELDRMHGLDLYDYGARHYDAIVPMFTQVDPLCEKYYSISPYVYCNNNPVKFIDLDGRDGVISICGHNITISANVYLYGKGATKTVQEQMQSDVNKVWGGNYSIQHKGTAFNVKFNIKLSLYEGKEQSKPLIILDKWNRFSRNNYIEVSDDCQRSYVEGGDEGQWRSKGRNGKPLSKDDPAPHEVAHLLGLADQYNDQNGPNKGWEGNIMGDSKNGKVDERNIDDILNNVWQEYNKWINLGNTGEFRYEINPK